MRKAITQKQRSIILNCKTCTEASKKSGAAISTCWHIMRKGSILKKHIKHWQKEEIKTLIKMKDKGFSNKAISDKLERTIPAVQKQVCIQRQKGNID